MTHVHRKLNALGYLCPLPLLLAVKEMTRLEAGEVLEIVGDDPGLLEDVPSWCDRAGHSLVEMEEEEGVVVCRVEKGHRDADDASLPPTDPGLAP